MKIMEIMEDLRPGKHFFLNRMWKRVGDFFVNAKLEEGDLFGKRCNRSRVLDQEHVFPFFISSLHIFKELIKNSELTFGDGHDKATI